MHRQLCYKIIEQKNINLWVQIWQYYNVRKCIFFRSTNSESNAYSLEVQTQNVLLFIRNDLHCQFFDWKRKGEMRLWLRLNHALLFSPIECQLATILQSQNTVKYLNPSSITKMKILQLLDNTSISTRILSSTQVVRWGRY